MTINFQAIQSIFISHSAFFSKNYNAINFEDQLDDSKDEGEAIVFALQKLRFILEHINKPELSKEAKKLLEEQLEQELKKLEKYSRKNQLKNKLDKFLDAIMKLGEELGKFIMAMLANDKILTPEEMHLLKLELSKFLAEMQWYNQQVQAGSKKLLQAVPQQFFKPQLQPQPKLVLEIIQQLVVKHNLLVNQLNGAPKLTR